MWLGTACLLRVYSGPVVDYHTKKPWSNLLQAEAEEHALKAKLGTVRQEIADAEGARDKALLAHKAAQQVMTRKCGNDFILNNPKLITW